MGLGHVVHGVGDVGRIAESLADLECPLVVDERLRVLASLIVDGADVVQGLRLPPLGADLDLDPQTFPGVLERLVVVASDPLEISEAHQDLGDAHVITDFPADL